MIELEVYKKSDFYEDYIDSQKEYYERENADAYFAERLAEKDREIALLKERICNGDVSRLTWIDDCIAKDKEIAELKQKLESVQASMYADVVDANMEVRRLKRALYIVLARSFCCMRELAARNALYDDECKWDNFKTKCREKAEEYK